MKKYELIESDIPGLYRVKALRNFNDVKKGDIGGYVSGEHNLPQEGGCWVYDSASVWGAAHISDNAHISDSARVSGAAHISDNAYVYGDCQVYDNARVGELGRLSFGTLSCDITDNRNIKIAVACSLGYVPDTKGFYIMYKKVKKDHIGLMRSIYDKSFEYVIGKTCEVPNAQISTESCAAGLHVSIPYYWPEGNCLIACRVHIDDIITVQKGKVRCNKLKVLYEVDI